MPAHHRPKQGLRLVIIIIVFCPGKLFGCPVYFFHDLGRIHASLFRIPRLDGAISHNSLCSLLCLVFSFFFIDTMLFMLAQPRSGHCFTFSRVGHLHRPLSLNYFGSLLATQDSLTQVLKAIVFS